MMIDAIHERWERLPPDRRPEACALRREPRLDGRPGRLRLAARHRPDGVLVGAVGGPAQRQPAVEGHHRAARPWHSGGRTALRQRAHRAVLGGDRRRGDRAGHRGAVGGHPGAVPAAPVGPDRLVVGGSAVHPAGLAEGAAGSRPHRVDALVSDRHLLAGRRRHDERVVGARRARPQLRRLGARRLGGRRPAGRLDRRGHRAYPASRWRRPQSADGPEY